MRSHTRFRALTAAVLLLSGVAAGCTDLFSTDVDNPNAVLEEALGDPAGATTLVNGLGASVTRALTAVYGPYHTATDELTWVGSREFWKNLDDGDVSDPINEYSDGAYPFMAEARWLGDYATRQLTAFDTLGTIRNRADLARAEIFTAIAYLTIGDMFDDFVINSDRTVAGSAIGEANMVIMYDSAIVKLDRALPVAVAVGSTELQRQILGLRARAKHGRAVWNLIKPARTLPGNPLVGTASGAEADAIAALALMGADTYRFRLTPVAQNLAGINVGFEMNNRGELRAGSQFVNANPTRPIVPADGIDGIAMVDHVTGAASPVVAAAIDECCRPAVANNVPMTQTSAREMILIIAEARLAAGDNAGFDTNINRSRAINALPDYDAAAPGALTRVQALEFERKTQMFLQGRRLADMYRFGSSDPRWLGTTAVNGMCFLPISYGERLANINAPQPTTARLCQP